MAEQSKVKLELDEKTDSEVVVLGRGMVTGMGANPLVFTAPDPTLLVVTGKCDAAENAILAMNAAKQNWLQKTEVKDQAIGELKLTLTSEGNYIQLKSGGDETKIRLANVNVMDDRSPKGIPPQVTDLAVTRGDDSGEADLTWHSLRERSNNYSIRYTVGDINTPNWIMADQTPGKSSITIGGLPVAQKVWFQVAGNGAAGRGGWSDPAYLIIG